MSKNILFLSEKFIKENSFVSDNVDPKHLHPVLKAVQDMYIHHMLGTPLYNKLQELVKNDQVTPIPADYKLLLEEYIQDSLLWYMLAELPVPLQMQVVNKGVVLRNGDAMQVSSTTDRKDLTDYCQKYAKWYAQRAIDYLRDNKDKYPEYMAPSEGCSDIRPDATQYNTGIFLGRTRSGRRGEFRDKYK